MCKCSTHLEGGGEVEEAPGEDDVVVGAEEEGDDDGAQAGALQQRAQLPQGTDRPSPGEMVSWCNGGLVLPPGVLAHGELHEEERHPASPEHHQVLRGGET